MRHIMPDSIPVVTQETELCGNIKVAVKEVQGCLSRLQAQLEGDMHIALGLQQQVSNFFDATKGASSPWSMAKPEPRDVSADMLQQAELQEEVDAAEEGIAVISARLEDFQQQLQAGREAANAWMFMLRVQRNRWHNRSSHLLSLPLGVLRIITHRASKTARLACSTLRDAHGTPGAGLLLPPVQADSDPDTPPPAAPFEGHDILLAWPQPSGVTKLRTLRFLPASTCEALSRTFPRLQALSILRGLETCSALAPGRITSLVLATTTHGPAQREVLLHGCGRHFSALQSLTLSGCKSQSVLADLSPLTALTRLTSLTLARGWPLGEEQPSEGWSSSSSEYSEDSLDYGQGGWGPDIATPPGPACTQAVWGVAAALPALARLCLDVPVDYHGVMPAEAPALSVLTHLAVQTDASMTTPAMHMGPEVPLLKVLGLLPALVSLHFLDGRFLFSDPQSARGRELVVEALRRRGVQSLQLSESFGDPSPETFAALLSPSLTCLKSSFIFVLTSAAILSRFPAPQPLRSLDITCSSQDPADARRALALLPTRLPELTRLALRLRTACSLYLPETGGPLEAPVPELAGLTNLQQLHICGGWLKAIIAESLPLLPALTWLELPELLPAAQAAVLVALTGLRSLHLGRRQQYDTFETGAEVLIAVRQMVGLTELVLDHDTLATPRLLTLLLPVPGMLRRLVVGDEVIREGALGVLGGAIHDICLC